MTLILYGSSLSPFVRKVRVVLIEKGVDYTLEQINPFRPPPDFEKLSPLKRIPVLRDTDWEEGVTLPDSSVIADYLENIFPTPALFPKSAFDRARALWLQEYVGGGIFPVMGSNLFYERVVKKFIRGSVTDQERARWAVTEALPPFFDYLERALKGREWLAGDAYSIADISVGAVMVNYQHSGEALDPDRWPGLAAHVARLHARPSFAALIEEEMPIVLKARSRA